MVIMKVYRANGNETSVFEQSSNVSEFMYFIVYV